MQLAMGHGGGTWGRVGWKVPAGEVGESERVLFCSLDTWSTKAARKCGERSQEQR